VTSRTYQQYCPLAEALDAVGERWSLLIVRELLGGPKRYTDLRNGLGAVSPTLLSARLEDLEAAGLVQQQIIPPPAARTVYALTDEGKSLGPVVLALTRWGMRRLSEPDPRHPPRPLMAARSALFAYADPKRLDASSRIYEVRVDGQPFTLTISKEAVELHDGPTDDIDLVISVGAADLIRMRRGTLLPAQAAKTGVIRYEPSDRARINEFLAVFGLEADGKEARKAQRRKPKGNDPGASRQGGP
jgi:DNA-binding HxlR family transcriptional regulator